MVSKRRPTVPRRARRDEDKERRRGDILRVALGLFRERSVAALTMAEVAKALGLAKGTLYLYFRTKEELFLAVVEDLLREWFEDVDARLSAVRESSDAGRVARLVARSLVRRDDLTRLLTILHTSLEHNVARDAARRFKQAVHARLLRTGALLEERLPFLRRGEGGRVLLRGNALVIGLRHLADPAPVVRQVLEEPGMDVFRVDFPREFEASFRALLLGMGAEASKGRA